MNRKQRRKAGIKESKVNKPHVDVNQLNTDLMLFEKRFINDDEKLHDTFSAVFGDAGEDVFKQMRKSIMMKQGKKDEPE